MSQLSARTASFPITQGKHSAMQRRQQALNPRKKCFDYDCDITDPNTEVAQFCSWCKRWYHRECVVVVLGDQGGLFKKPRLGCYTCKANEKRIPIQSEEQDVTEDTRTTQQVSASVASTHPCAVRTVRDLKLRFGSIQRSLLVWTIRFISVTIYNDVLHSCVPASSFSFKQPDGHDLDYVQGAGLEDTDSSPAIVVQRRPITVDRTDPAQPRDVSHRNLASDFYELSQEPEHELGNEALPQPVHNVEQPVDGEHPEEEPVAADAVPEQHLEGAEFPKARRARTTRSKRRTPWFCMVVRICTYE
jgi:hypothetical protein